MAQKLIGKAKGEKYLVLQVSLNDIHLDSHTIMNLIKIGYDKVYVIECEDSVFRAWSDGEYVEPIEKGQIIWDGLEGTYLIERNYDVANEGIFRVPLLCAV